MNSASSYSMNNGAESITQTLDISSENNELRHGQALKLGSQLSKISKLETEAFLRQIERFCAPLAGWIYWNATGNSESTGSKRKKTRPLSQHTA